MAEKLPRDDEPSLELPSLFRRGRRKSPAAPAEATTSPTEEPAARASSTAALAVGAAVGLLGCVLTWVGLQGCELVTGTDSCGGPGLLVLVLILVAMVAAGAAALRLLGVRDAATLSLLGVGLLATTALVFLTGYLDEPWMFLVVPGLTSLCFGAANWVTTRSVDEADLEPARRRERHDVR